MKSKLSLLVFLLQLVCFTRVSAQIWISNEDIYNEAEQFFLSDDYEEALPLYQLLEKKGVNTANISYKIGACYLNLKGRKSNSIPYLERASKRCSLQSGNLITDSLAPIKSLLLLGVAYRVDNQPQRAITIFKTLSDSLGSTNPDLIAIVDMHIKRCENAVLLGAFPGESRTSRLPDIINSEVSNFNPVATNNQEVLYFMNQLKFYDAIMESKYINGNWAQPENITPAIGSDGDHLLLDVSADGSQLLLYNYQILAAGEIYEVNKTADGWSKILPLNENINTKFNETHASFSSDGKTIYFTSNRPGGIGGTDIYKSSITNTGDWGPAENLGVNINTAYDEETPFINTDDNILYFSSQGHLNMGGFDVFYALRKSEIEWREPINMGSPVCTTDDDLFYFPLHEGAEGLMSRLEPNSNSVYDIYQYTSLVLPNTPRYRIRGKSKKSTENSGVEKVFVIDQNSNDTILVSNTDLNGEYDLVLPAGGYVVITADETGNTGSTSVNLLDDLNGTLLLSDNAIDTNVQKLPANITALPVSELVDTLILKSILFDFNTTNPRAEYAGYMDGLKALLLKYPQLTFTLIGYADSKGDEIYNQQLSEKRAIAISSILLSDKISTSRISTSGMGEKNPICINNNEDGSDNPEGRKCNRRVEIIPNESAGLILIHQSGGTSSLKFK